MKLTDDMKAYIDHNIYDLIEEAQGLTNDSEIAYINLNKILEDVCFNFVEKFFPALKSMPDKYL